MRRLLLLALCALGWHRWRPSRYVVTRAGVVALVEHCPDCGDVRVEDA